MRVFIVCAMFAMFGSVFAGETSLPEPKKTGGKPVLQAIAERASAPGNDFPAGEISDEAIATILWAASGKGRDDSHWTVPMASSKPPYCGVYYVTAEGVYRYNWEKHALTEVKAGDARAVIASQAFGKTAPGIILITDDVNADAASPNRPLQRKFAHILSGVMHQNIQLAGEAVGVGSRVINSIDRDIAAEWLGLENADEVIFAIYLGGK